MDFIERHLTFQIDVYDGLSKIFDTYVKNLALNVIERGRFDTWDVLDNSFESPSENILGIMNDFGQGFKIGDGTVLVINDEYLLKSEIIRDEDIVRFKLWILSVRSRIDELKKYIQSKLIPYVYYKMALDITWAIASRNSVDYIVSQTELNEIVFSEAYPYLDVPLDTYINTYLKHKAPVLILMGPPGTGKTRFIKHILKTIGLEKKIKAGKNSISVLEEPRFGPTVPEDQNNKSSGKNPSILYSMEDSIFKNDQFFVKFLLEPFDAMVLEDIDFNLGSRKDGNTFMYKLLGGSDGLISGVKRKIILSTNMRGLSNIDEALLRPGRCFDTIHTRALDKQEAYVLADKLKVDLTKLKKKDSNKEGYTLADIYNI